jgi:hypothetical protein
MQIGQRTETAFSSSFRHFLTFKYDTNGQLSTRLYDKRDDFNFANMNLEYGVYFSQLIRSKLNASIRNKRPIQILFSGLEQNINTFCKRIKINEIQHI